jgi:hypothetical protein
VRELAANDKLTAEFAVSRWDSTNQEWVGPTTDEPVANEEPDARASDPSYVILEAYKPEFLRDLGP